MRLSINSLNALKRKGALIYCAMVALVSFAMQALAASFFHLVGLQARSTFDGVGPGKLLVFAGIIGPAVETLIFQVLIVETVSKLGGGLLGGILLSWLSFILIHVSSGVGTVVCAGLIGGGWLSATYALWRADSIPRAASVTYLCHALNNLMAILIIAYS